MYQCHLEVQNTLPFIFEQEFFQYLLRNLMSLEFRWKLNAISMTFFQREFAEIYL